MSVAFQSDAFQSDAFQTAEALIEVINETVGFTETTADEISTFIVQVVNETVAFTEATETEVLSTLIKVVSETVGISEEVIRSRSLVRVVDEGLSLSEAVVSTIVWLFIFPREVEAYMSATIREATPNTADTTSQVVRVKAGSGTEQRALLHVNHDTPPGSTIKRADLRLVFSEDVSGTFSIYIDPLDEEWDAADTTWANQPDIKVGQQIEAVVESATAGDELFITITSQVASVHSEGDPWHGVRVTTDSEDPVSFWGSNALENLPKVDVEDATEPDAPFDQAPAGGRAVSKIRPPHTWSFRDQDANDRISGAQIQIHTDDLFDDEVDPLVYDSGEFGTTHTIFDGENPPTGAAAHPDLAVDTIYYRQIRHQDTRGLWSEFGPIESFIIRAKGTLTLTSPATDTVTPPTPTFTATLAGQVQRSVLVERLQGSVWQEHHRFNWAVTDSGEVTLPDERVLQHGEQYRVTWFATDDQDREDMPGDPARYEASQEFTLAEITDVVPDVLVEQDPNVPFATLSWEFEGADRFMLSADTGEGWVNFAPQVVEDFDVELDSATLVYSATVPSSPGTDWRVVALDAAGEAM